MVTTDLESSAEDLVARYAARWGIEQAFADARQIMGVGEAHNRDRAVERTVPFGLICFSVVSLWYALHGHAPDDVTTHRTRARWYPTKAEPSYDEMARQTPSRHHRRQISRPMPRAGQPARNPGRPRRLGSRRHMINQNCETRAALWVPGMCTEPATCCFV